MYKRLRFSVDSLWNWQLHIYFDTSNTALKRIHDGDNLGLQTTFANEGAVPSFRSENNHWEKLEQIMVEIWIRNLRNNRVPKCSATFWRGHRSLNLNHCRCHCRCHCRRHSPQQASTAEVCSAWGHHRIWTGLRWRQVTFLCSTRVLECPSVLWARNRGADRGPSSGGPEWDPVFNLHNWNKCCVSIL